MQPYNKILVAVALGEYTGDLIQRGLAVAADPAAVHVVYVQQGMSSVFQGVGPIGSALEQVGPAEDQLQRELKSRLADWTDSLGIAEDHVHYLVGKPSEVLVEFATDNAVDLIVIGTRDRKGLQRLLGSTAHAVVQEAPCDVLTVRVN